jgi:hypothetical protein
LSHELAELVKRGEVFLEKHDASYRQLAATHTDIPMLLSDQRQAAVGDLRRLPAITASLTTARSTRTLATAKLWGEGPELSELRTALGDAIRKHGEELTRPWCAEYQAALQKVEELRARGRAISAALRISEAEVFEAVPRAVVADDAVDVANLYRAIGQLRGVMERLDAAASLTNGIQIDYRHTSQLHARTRNGDVAAPSVELFEVTRRFACLTDGLWFERG